MGKIFGVCAFVLIEALTLYTALGQSSGKVSWVDFCLQTDLSDKPVQLFKSHKEFELVSHTYETAKKSLSSNDKLELGTYHLVHVSGFDLPLVHFNRGSDTVVVLGQGFGDAKERWKNFAALLKDYDIVEFDYRLMQSRFWWYLNDPQRRLISDEKYDVIEVVNFVKKLKNYKRVVGLAECYSCLTFAAAQAACQEKGQRLFDALILDCAFISLQKLAVSTFQDPCLCCNNKHGGCQIKCLKWDLCAKKIVLKMAQLLCSDISIKNHLPYIQNIPILFIHGKNDKLVPMDDLISCGWNFAKTRKALFTTPFWHIGNFMDWGVYKWVCDCFINASNYDEFVKALQL